MLTVLLLEPIVGMSTSPTRGGCGSVTVRDVTLVPEFAACWTKATEAIGVRGCEIFVTKAALVW